MKQTIKEFVETIKTSETEIDISSLISTKKYVPIEEKVSIAKKTIDLSAEYDHGVIKLHSYKKHLAFIFNVIETHTDLCFADDWAERIHEYDMLCENDLFDDVIDTFAKDYNASREVLDMMCADMLAENSLEVSVAKLAQSVAENLDVFVGALTDKLEDFDIEKIIPENLDLNKLQGFLNKFK